MPRAAPAAARAWDLSSSASVVCLVLSLLAFAGAFALGEQAPARLFSPEARLYWSGEGAGGWFGADALGMLRRLDGGESGPGPASREWLNPALSLVVQPLVAALRTLLDAEARTAIALLSGATAAGTVALLFLTLQRLGRDVAEAALLCLLTLASAAWLFFYTVPGLAPLGAFTVVLALYVAAGPAPASPRREALQLLGVNVATLAAPLTNGLFGALLSFARLPRRRALAVCAAALALVLALAALARPGDAPPAGSAASPASAEGASVLSGLLHPQAGGPLAVSKVFWLDTLVAPRPQPLGANPHWQGLSLQHAAPGSGTPAGLPALLLWGALLVAGALALARSGAPRAFKAVLVGGLAGQWLLQLLHGAETFRHSLHVLPLLVLLASFAFEWPRARRAAALALVLLLLGAGFNNSRVLAAAQEHVAAQGSARTLLLEEMARRPLGPWPRGEGHLLLGVPGAPLNTKAWLEPAGAFSPWIGSFGLSFWLGGEDGTLLQAAESIPLAQTQQRLRLEAGRWPGADFATPLYAGRWQMQADGAWRLELEPQPLPPGQRLELVLRAVGPAAGPVHRLQQEGRTLRVNGRWTLELPEGGEWRLGEEQQGLRSDSAEPDLESPGGWGYARAVLPAGTPSAPVRVVVRSLLPLELGGAATARLPVLQLPDPDFAASLRAQVQQLAMSVEGRETRPGDPLTYGQAWLGDSAHVAVALARSGNLALARRLASDLAERDFFGGLGSEADAPGLALWALEAVGSRLSDPAFDRAAWPHVRRKAAWVLDCMQARTALLAEPQGPVLARLAGRAEARLVCLPPGADGLIAGRAQERVPRLYLTAVGYRGLSDAAAFARRLGHADEAARWQAAAERLRAAWNAQMKAPGTGRPGWAELGRWMRAAAAAQGLQGARHAAVLWADSRAAGGELRSPLTDASGLWPTRVAGEARPEFAERLRARGLPEGPGEAPSAPQRPHLDIAAAHQWLLLGEPGRARQALARHWARQVAPGAYGGWDGEGAQHGSHGWEAVQGWVDPPHVTPHYRTSAEVLALQLDMLTRLEEVGEGEGGKGGEPVVVIGEGVPADWLARPLAAGGIHVRGARVDWRWQDGRMEVQVRGRPLRVRLAAVFPPQARVAVRYSEPELPQE